MRQTLVRSRARTVHTLVLSKAGREGALWRSYLESSGVRDLASKNPILYAAGHLVCPACP